MNKVDMGESGPLSHQTVAIFGLGLMGGSLALALRGKCKKLIGIEPDPQARAFAIENKIVDQVSDRGKDVLHQADLIILATPISMILKIIVALPDLHTGEAIVIDIGSTKMEIVNAMADLPSRFTPIGGHPICGKEKLSILNADEQIFIDTSFVFAPVGATPEKARRLAESLATIIGANPVWLSAEDHDLILAATSHAPYLLAAALTAATPNKYQQFQGPGYQSATRLAATPPSMMLEILQSNPINVIRSLENVQEQIALLLSQLQENDYSGLRVQLEKIAQNLTSNQ